MIASWAFTTINPEIGTVSLPQLHQTCTIADLPGLIEGAHQDRGLGHTFLKHVERSRLLCYVIDMAQHERDPWDDFMVLRSELREYDPALLDKRGFIVGNKLDSQRAIPAFRRFLAAKNADPDYKDWMLFGMSAKNNPKLDVLRSYLQRLLAEEELRSR